MLIINDRDSLRAKNDSLVAVTRELYPFFNDAQICTCQTRYWYDSESYPQAISWDGVSSFVDTNRAWVPYPSVQLPSGDHYIFDRLSVCQRRAQTLNNTIIYFQFGPGFPRLIRPNSDPPFDDDPNADGYAASQYDSIISKSLTHATELFYFPGCDTVWHGTNVDLTGYYGSRWTLAARGAADKTFLPGQYWNYRCQPGSSTKDNTADSTKQWVFAAMIDADTPHELAELVRRAYRGNDAFAPDGSTTHWAIVDAENDPSDALFAPFYSALDIFATIDTASSFYYTLRTLYGSQILFDLDQPLITVRDTPDDTLFASSGGIPDCTKVYFGYNGGQTLAAGDSCLFYWTAGSYSDGALPDAIASLTDFPYADAAWAFSRESFNESSGDTNLRTDDHTLACEYLANGATYFVGNVREVSTTITAGIHTYIPDAMHTPWLTFGMAQALVHPNKAQGVATGWMLGYWRQGDPPSAADVAYTGHCTEILSYTATAPASADSVRFHIVRRNNTTLDSTINVSGGGAVSFAIGSRWISPGIDYTQSTVTYIGTDGSQSTYSLHIDQ